MPRKTQTKKKTTRKPAPKKRAVKKAAPKKTTRKRVARKPAVKKRRAPKAAPKKRAVKKAPTKRKVVRRVKKVVEPQISYPRLPLPKIETQKAPISPHVLNLKDLPEEEIISSPQKAQASQEVFADLFTESSVLKGGKKAVASLQRAKEKVEKLPQFKMRVPKEFERTVNRSYSLPKVSLPRITKPTIPHISLPQVNKGSLPFYWKRTLIGFALFAFLFVLPVHGFGYYKELTVKKDVILQTATEAIEQLQQTQDAFGAQDLLSAHQGLQDAELLFIQAQDELNGINGIIQGLAQLVPTIADEFTTAQNLLEIGSLLSKSGAALTETIAQINNQGDSFVTNKLQTLSIALSDISPHIEEASQLSKELEVESLPLEYQSKVEKLQQTLPLINESLSKTLSLSDFLLDVLGHDHTRRYLFVFQNNNEIRPTGGFIGSIALVDIDRGIIENIEIPGGGSYDLQGSLTEYVKAPYALRPIAERWEFHDANFFPDFPTSAEKLIWFFEQSGGPTVDGVIALNATLLQQLLGVTGPIELENYDLTITQQNFFDTVQSQVEFDYDKEKNKPKQIIADLAPEVLNRVFNADSSQIVQTLSLVQRALDEREIQLYFYDQAKEQVVQDHGWGGALIETEGDYLNIVSTNVAGGKTDSVTSQYSELDVVIQDDGSIINRLRVTKTHEGDPDGVFTSIPNVDYMRIMVPYGSELLSVSGFNPPAENLFDLSEDTQTFPEDPDLKAIRLSKSVDLSSGTEVFEESGKTVFANWLITGVGESRTVELTYRLPFTVQSNTELTTLEAFSSFVTQESPKTKSYGLVIQKQSGKRNATMTTTIHLPDGTASLWSYPEYLEETNTTLSFTQKVVEDIVVGTIFE